MHTCKTSASTATKSHVHICCMYLALCLVAEGQYCALLGNMKGSTPCKEPIQIKLTSFATFPLQSHLLYPVLGGWQKAVPPNRCTSD